MSDADDTVPATASQVAAALKDGHIDALVELAKTLPEKTGDAESAVPRHGTQDQDNSALRQSDGAMPACVGLDQPCLRLEGPNDGAGTFPSGS